MSVEIKEIINAFYIDLEPEGRNGLLSDAQVSALRENFNLMTADDVLKLKTIIKIGNMESDMGEFLNVSSENYSLGELKEYQKILETVLDRLDQIERIIYKEDKDEDKTVLDKRFFTLSRQYVGSDVAIHELYNAFKNMADEKKEEFLDQLEELVKSARQETQRPVREVGKKTEGIPEAEIRKLNNAFNMQKAAEMISNKSTIELAVERIKEKATDAKTAIDNKVRTISDYVGHKMGQLQTNVPAQKEKIQHHLNRLKDFFHRKGSALKEKIDALMKKEIKEIEISGPSPNYGANSAARRDRPLALKEVDIHVDIEMDEVPAPPKIISAPKQLEKAFDTAVETVVAEMPTVKQVDAVAEKLIHENLGEDVDLEKLLELTKGWSAGENPHESPHTR